MSCAMPPFRSLPPLHHRLSRARSTTTRTSMTAQLGLWSTTAPHGSLLGQLTVFRELRQSALASLLALPRLAFLLQMQAIRAQCPLRTTRLSTTQLTTTPPARLSSEMQMATLLLETLMRAWSHSVEQLQTPPMQRPRDMLTQ